MKRTILVFVISALVLASTALWFFTSSTALKTLDILQFGVILVLVGFGLFFGFKRLTSVKRGEPVEDELSKKVVQKAAAISYFISIYLWLLVMYLTDKVNLEAHVLVGAGIMAMAVIFAVSWLVINFSGIKND